MPVPDLLRLCVADDMFYYLNLARNAASGLGVTFDGETITNGFHPLYFGLLYLMFKCGQGTPISPDGYVHLALSFLALIDVVSGLILFRLLRRLFGNFPAFFALLFWYFHPYPLLVSLSGVEVPLATCFFALLLWQYLGLVQRGRGSLRDLLQLGALAGLMLLSRTDSCLLLAALGLDALYRWGYRQQIVFPWLGATRRLRTWLYPPAIWLTPFILLLSPWLLWNRLHFGTFFQVSGEVLPFRAHSIFDFYHRHDPQRTWNLLVMMAEKTQAWFQVLKKSLFLQHSFLPAFLAGFIVAMFLVAGQRLTQDLRRRIGLIIIILPAGLLTIGLFYGLYFWHRQTWYFHSSYFLVALLLGGLLACFDQIVLASLESRSRRLILGSICLLSITFSSQLAVEIVDSGGFYPWQAKYSEVARTVSEMLPPSARIGAFNAGIYGYYSRPRVINLDGVVNAEIYAAMRARRIFAYIEDKKIDYLLDHVEVIASYQIWSQTEFMNQLEVVKEFETPKSSGNITLFKIRPAMRPDR